MLGIGLGLGFVARNGSGSLDRMWANWVWNMVFIMGYRICIWEPEIGCVLWVMDKGTGNGLYWIVVIGRGS